jgi:hypothetical protein
LLCEAIETLMATEKYRSANPTERLSIQVDVRSTSTGCRIRRCRHMPNPDFLSPYTKNSTFIRCLTFHPRIRILGLRHKE